jgi:Flp pilus assembly protein TadG
MRFAIRSLSARLARFATNAAGNVALFFGLSAPLLFGFVGVAVDYSTWSRQTTVLQKAADGAALAAANELRVAEPDSRRIQAVAESVVRGQVKLGLGDEPVTVKAELVKTREGNANQTDKDAEAVKVTLWQRKAAVMSRLVTPELTDIEVSATAKLVGGTKICVIGLDDNAPGTVRLEDSARISAGGCSVYVNSTSPSAVRSEEDARIVSLLTCTAGGYKGGSANFAPKAPTTDCPRTKDPLAGRPTPSVGACKYNNRVLEAGLHLLQPGTYCGGLTLKPGAIAMLSPGIYVVKDGPLHVGPPVLSIGLGPIGLGVLPATLKGTNVGFYFTGMVKPDDSGAVVPMRFMKESVVEMTAPKTGEMAGLLFREDTNAAPDRRFEIVSDSARRLVGTIYLPRGVFSVSANQPVADKSEYAAIITKRMELSKAPNLVLNDRYADTDVPVPEGIGPNSGETRLTR